MQRGRIDHRSVKSVYKIVFQRDGQVPKPVGRLTTQLDLDPNLSDHYLLVSVFGLSLFDIPRICRG